MSSQCVLHIDDGYTIEREEAKAHSPRRGLCVLGLRQHRHPCHPYMRDHSRDEGSWLWLDFDDVLLLSQRGVPRTRITSIPLEKALKEVQGIFRRGLRVTEEVREV